MEIYVENCRYDNPEKKGWNENCSHNDILLVGIENCETHNADRTAVHCTARLLDILKYCRIIWASSRYTRCSILLYGHLQLVIIIVFHILLAWPVDRSLDFLQVHVHKCALFLGCYYSCYH